MQRHHQLSGWPVLLALLALAAAPARADDAPTPAAAAGKPAAPATRPTATLAVIRAHLNHLASDNFQTREAARVALMGLQRADLPVLRDAVARSMPLAPSQYAVLKDIVTQVYLSGDDYPAEDGDVGFLGVSLPGAYEDPGPTGSPRGVQIVSRVPGFCAYRMLQNGDAVLSMTEAGETTKFSTSQEFIDTVKQVRAGRTVTFEVLRQGRVVRVPITLDRRPAAMETAFSADWLKEFMNRRADAVDELWERDFAPLLRDLLG
jgi:hypothetical protein